jgi:hypothetical protein
MAAVCGARVLMAATRRGRAFWVSSTSTSSHASLIPCQSVGTGAGKAPSTMCQLALPRRRHSSRSHTQPPWPGIGSRASRTMAAAWWWASRSRAGVQGSNSNPARRRPARVTRTQVWPSMRRRSAQPAASHRSTRWRTVRSPSRLASRTTAGDSRARGQRSGDERRPGGRGRRGAPGRGRTGPAARAPAASGAGRCFACAPAPPGPADGGGRRAEMLGADSACSSWRGDRG